MTVSTVPNANSALSAAPFCLIVDDEPRLRQVMVHLIQPGTPPEVKYNIFRRINTGGVVLTAQEIRHALNQGQATSFLAELVGQPAFLEATDNGVDPDRMQDRELALRFIAFTRSAPTTYTTPNLDLFLTRQMTSHTRKPTSGIQSR